MQPRSEVVVHKTQRAVPATHTRSVPCLYYHQQRSNASRDMGQTVRVGKCDSRILSPLSTAHSHFAIEAFDVGRCLAREALVSEIFAICGASGRSFCATAITLLNLPYPLVSGSLAYVPYRLCPTSPLPYPVNLTRLSVTLSHIPVS